jgi:hypothetical protein
MTVKADGAVSPEPGMEQGNGGEENDALDVQRDQQEAAPSPKRLKRYRNE